MHIRKYACKEYIRGITRDLGTKLGEPDAMEDKGKQHFKKEEVVSKIKNAQWDLSKS